MKVFGDMTGLSIPNLHQVDLLELHRCIPQILLKYQLVGMVEGNAFGAPFGAVAGCGGAFFAANVHLA